MDYACERRTNPWEIWALPTEQPRTPPKTSEPNPKRGVELKADCLDDSPTGPMQLKTDRYFTTCLSVSPDFKKDTSRARDSAGCVQEARKVRRSCQTILTVGERCSAYGGRGGAGRETTNRRFGDGAQRERTQHGVPEAARH